MQEIEVTTTRTSRPGVAVAPNSTVLSGSKPVTEIEIKLVSAGAVVSGPNEPGEIYFRAAGMFEGCYRPWQLKGEALEEGWFKTGDLARRDEDGFYWIVGRSKEAINVGSLKVFPSEIEAVLLSHPAVEAVLVFGVADPLFGEVPHAQIKLAAGAHCSAGELMEYADQRLSVFKVPRRIEFVGEFSKTATWEAQAHRCAERLTRRSRSRQSSRL